MTPEERARDYMTRHKKWVPWEYKELIDMFRAAEHDALERADLVISEAFACIDNDPDGARSMLKHYLGRNE